MSATTLSLPPFHRLAESRREEAQQLARLCGLHHLTVQVLMNRGMRTADDIQQFMNPSRLQWVDPLELEDMDVACQLLADAVRDGHRICVHGDYDCDGVSATALLTSFLRDIEADGVWYIPHRIDEGYGISADGVRWAADQGAKLLVTVDCGTSSPAEVALARELGLKVIVTDHHRVPPRLPEADALVNPQRPTCSYRFKKLSGVGVALKLVEATCRRLGLPADYHTRYLDLATLGTVGDVVSLTGENRFLVLEGLKRIAQGGRPGITALLQAAGVALPLTARDVAFKVVPPINASGRLDRAGRAVELLLERDESRAETLAQELVGLNGERRDIEARVAREARERLLQDDAWRQAGVIVEGGDNWHRGVVGIVASRLLEEFGVPALVISIEGEEAKGSARAPHGVDLFRCLSECAEVLSHYGGHPRAGGFSLKAADVSRFRELMGEAVARQTGQEPEGQQTVDASVRLSELSLDLLRELEQLAPFGEGNPEPLFLVEQARLSGVEYLKGLHARLQIMQDGFRYKAIQFGRGDRPASVPEGAETVNLLIHPERDTWRGEERLNLRVRQVWEDAMEGLDGKGPEVGPLPAMGAASGRLVDARHVVDKRRYLNGLAQAGTPVVGLVRSGGQARARFRYAVFNRLDEAVQMLAVAVPRVALLPYGVLREGGELAGAEVVLLSPPPSLSVLGHPLLSAAKRVHLLFTGAELEEERDFYHAATLNQSRMEVLYQTLRRQLADGPTVVSTAELAQVPSPVAFNRISVEAGLKAFEELGLLRRDGSGALSLVKGVKTELSASATYRLYSTLADKFDEVHGLLQKGTDALTPLIWRSIATP